MFRKLTYLMMLILIGVGSAFGQTTHNMSETWRTSDGLASLVTIDQNLLQYKAENTLGTVNIKINGTSYTTFETAVAAITEQFETSTTTSFPIGTVSGTTVVNLKNDQTLGNNTTISGKVVVVGSKTLSISSRDNRITLNNSNAVLILQGNVVIDGNNTSRTNSLIGVTSGKLYMAENAKIQSCRNTSTSNYGGAVYLSGSNAKFYMAGGVIGDENATMVGKKAPIMLTGYTFNGHCYWDYDLSTGNKGNKAYIGGGVYLENASMFMNGGYISGNEATYGPTTGGDGSSYGGGGIYSWKSNVTINGGEISNNLALAGGGIHFCNGEGVTTPELNINGGTFKWNCATCGIKNPYANFNCGGAIFTNGGTVSVKGGTFTENRAPMGGSALYLYGNKNTPATVDYMEAYKNYTCWSGTVCMEAAGANIKGGKFYENESYQGTIACYPVYGVSGTPTTTIGNDDGTGPEIYNNKVLFGIDLLEMSYDPYQDAYDALGVGGALYLCQLNLDVKGGKIYGNEAAVAGGAVFIVDGNCTIEGGELGCSVLDEESGEYLNLGNKALGTSNASEQGLENFSPDIKGDGGGVYVYYTASASGKKTTISGSNTFIRYNEAERNGGGLFVADGEVDITGGTFDGNKAKGSITASTGSNSDDTGNGGGMYVKSSIETDMTGGTLINNVAANNGGGLYLKGAFDMDGGSFGTSASNGNIATAHDGGGVYVESGNLDVSNGTFSGNKAEAGNGGGFYVASGTVNLKKGTQTGAAIAINNANTAINGGGFYANGGNVTLEDANIASNEATGNGGGVYSNGGEFTISNTSDFTGGILSNKAVNGGGGYVNGGTLEITGGNIDNNSVSANGGGFYVNGGTLKLYGGIIGRDNGNNADGNGGGFYLRGGEANILQGTDETSATVQLNTAANGAGIYMEGTSSSSKAVANFEDGTIQNNVASANGGGIYLANYSELNMSGASTITGNHVPATGKGGGVFKQGGTNTVLKVGGTALQIDHNYAGVSYSSTTRNNAYLDAYSDYITVDPATGLGSTDPEHPELETSIKIGISVNVTDTHTDLPTPVIHCTSVEKINDIFYMLKHPNSDNGVFDDAARYVAVYQSTPDPFNDNEIFFISTWAAEVEDVPDDFIQEGSDGSERVDISSPKGLTWFMILVNGLNGYDAHPNLGCTMVADINLEGSFWTPIGEWDHNDPAYDDDTKPKPVYRGVFDGQGHTISIVSTCGIIGYYNYGLFGRTEGATVKNIVLADCSLVAGEAARMGGLIGEMNGGTVENCTVSGNINPSGSETINNDQHSCVLGGLIGETIGACQIRNCIATEEINATAKTGSIYPGMQAYTVGGLVGMTSAGTVVENCFANPEIHHSGARGDNTTLTEWDRYVGGIVGENAGTIRNCYVRLERGNQFTGEEIMGPAGSPTSKPVSKFGMFAGRNNGTIDSCYYPVQSLRSVLVDETATPNQPLVNSGTAPTNLGEYDAVTRPYTYTSYLVDNQVGGGTGEETTLLSKLNNWATTHGSNYSHWMRTKGSTVNDDYPVLRYDNLDGTLNYTVVGSKDRVHLEYDNSFNDMYGRFEPGKKGCLFIYKTPWDEDTDGNPTSEIITADNSGNNIKVFVEDGVALLQAAGSTLVNTYTCHEFNDASRSWHHISSSLNNDSPIGFNYENNGQVAYSDASNPCGASVNSAEYASFLPAGIPMADLDLYCFYEKEYHWINFKRNSSSHWHMNDQHQKIAYTNESNLVAGKGYLASFAGRTFVQSGGELTNGDVTISVTAEAGSLNASAENALGAVTPIPANEGTELKGYNLLGNPYQSYLDMTEFLSENGDLFASSNDRCISIPTYAIYDTEKDAYVQGIASTPSRGSYAPAGILAPHEGFFIVVESETEKGLSATFTNDMRLDTDEPTTNSRAEQPAYPLVNLVVTDESGESDLAAVEFGRPQAEAAAKMMNIGANGKVYFHYADNDYALLYLNEDTDQLPVRFDAIENGTYTMTWSTANATFSYLHLVDNMTGIDVDMLTSDAYTFTASSSDYKSRFKLMFAYTSVEENEAASTSSASFAFMHDGALIVNGEGMLEVIDMSGRTIVSSRLTDAQNTVSLPQAAQGVYVLRLTNDNQSKVQKIVIE